MSWNLTWKDLSLKQIYAFNEVEQNPPKALEYLSKEFNLEANSLNSILLDFYFYALKFAKTQGNFTPTKTSAFFSILKQTLDVIIATPQIKPEKDYNSFKETLLLHSVQRPPFSERVFDANEMKAINDYALDTCFRHYLLYKYAFTKKRYLNVVAVLETPKVDENIENLNSEGSDLQATADEAAKLGLSASGGKSTSQLPPGIELLTSAQKTERAYEDLKLLVSAAVNSKLDELKSSLQQSLRNQEEQILSQINQVSLKTEAIRKSANELPSPDQ